MFQKISIPPSRRMADEMWAPRISTGLDFCHTLWQYGWNKRLSRRKFKDIKTPLCGNKMCCHPPRDADFSVTAVNNVQSERICIVTWLIIMLLNWVIHNSPKMLIFTQQKMRDIFLNITQNVKQLEIFLSSTFYSGMQSPQCICFNKV